MRKVNLLQELTQAGSYLILPKRLMHKLGLQAALVLCDLISKEAVYLRDTDDTDGWFFSREDARTADTTLSAFQQREALSVLRSNGLLELERRGVYAKMHFRLNHAAVRKLLSEESNGEILKNSISSPQIIREPEDSKKRNLRTSKAILEHWNNLPHVRHHVRPEAKVYKNSLKAIGQLLAGQLHLNPWDDVWLKRNGISKHALRRRWRGDEVRRGINEMARLFHPAYWPRDKHRLPTDLPSLIYNPQTQRSMFLLIIDKPVLTLAELKERSVAQNTKQHIRDAAVAIAKTLNVIRNTQQLRPNEYSKIVHEVVPTLVDAHRKVCTAQGEEFAYIAVNFEEALKQFLEWCEDKYGGYHDIGLPYLYNKAWKEFIKCLE